MNIVLLRTAEERAAYERWLSSHSLQNLWQSLAWESYQHALKRETRIYAAMNEDGEISASALVIIDRTSMGLSTWDIPRGPLINEVAPTTYAADFLHQIALQAKKERCLTLYFSPLQPITFGKTSDRHIYPEATRIIDLHPSEEEILKQMKPKGRYNISVAERHGIRVNKSEDIAAFAALMTETTKRDRFTGLPISHYQTFLHSLRGSFLLLAFDSHTPNKPISGLLGVKWAKTAVYYYGASSYEHRALMSPYLLQFEAMRLCKANECTSYDLLGIAPPNAPIEHPWQGISGFKEKFGGEIVEYPHERQMILHPILNRMLSLKRRILG